MDLVDECEHPPGCEWDCDFIHMQISSGCIPILSKYWTLGGGASRIKGLQGLELSSDPFVLRIKPVLERGQAEVDWLANFGKRLCLQLASSGETGHPVLIPAEGPNASVALSTNQKMVDADHLRTCILELVEEEDMQLHIYKYGMKIPAQRFFERDLLACFEQMQQDLGCRKATNFWNQKQIDYGTQGRINNKPVLVFPMGTLHEIPWVRRYGIFNYSLLGKAGQGFGGLQIFGKMQLGLNCQKVTIYPGPWVHYSKAIGMPLQPPANSTNRWFTGQLAKFQALLDHLYNTEANLGGIRVEMRFGIGAQQPQTWQEVVEELEEKFESIIEHVWVKEVSLEELFSQLHEVLQMPRTLACFPARGMPLRWQLHHTNGVIGPGCPRTLASPALGLTRVPTKGKWLEQHGALKVSMKIWTGDPGQCSGNSTRLFPTTGLSFSSQQQVQQQDP